MRRERAPKHGVCAALEGIAVRDQHALERPGEDAREKGRRDRAIATGAGAKSRATVGVPSGRSRSRSERSGLTGPSVVVPKPPRIAVSEDCRRRHAS
jgi:hypothetical protein